MRDDLEVWCGTRRRVPWDLVGDPGPTGVGGRDGLRHLIGTTDRDRRLLSALDLLRADLTVGLPLDFAMMRRWQARVLGTRDPGFRTGPAFAKGGRERYGLDAGRGTGSRRACATRTRPRHRPRPAPPACTWTSASSIPSRTATPRAALLALTYVLGRSGVVLDQVGPVRRLSRSADAEEGALELARLVAVLIRAARSRVP